MGTAEGKDGRIERRKEM